METIYFIGYTGVVMLAVMIVYAICRVIDYRFLCKEETRRCLIGPELIDYTADKIKLMSVETAKEINDRLFNMSGKEDKEP